LRSVFHSIARTIEAAGCWPSCGRVERAEHGVRVHDDLVGGEGDQRAAAHRVVGHVHRHLALAGADRVRDLLGGECEAARRVQHDVDRDVLGREPERAQHLLAVLDVDVAHEREADEAERLLAVDEGDQPVLGAPLPAAQELEAVHLEAASLQHGQERREEKEDPDDVEDAQRDGLRAGAARGSPCRRA
jgi:hypothetical protein